MFRGGGRWLCFSERFRYLKTTSLFSTDAKNTIPNKNNSNNNNNHLANITDERYRQLENLDMVTAAKMLFSDPPKKKKFGFDFHLVQFFFACLPSLAVYLVAQYARYEMRKMDVLVEQKRKEKEEKEAKEKEKEMELNPPDEKEAKSYRQISEVKERLEKLEEAVKEIVVETKKKSSSNLAQNQVTDDEKKHPTPSTSSDTTSGSESNKAKEENHVGKPNSLKSKPEIGEESKGSVATPNSSLQDPKGQSHSGGGS